MAKKTGMVIASTTSAFRAEEASHRKQELARRNVKPQPNILDPVEKSAKGDMVNTMTNVFPAPGMPTTTRKKPGPGGLK